MATIRTAIQIYDGMTRPIQAIQRAMDGLIDRFETIQSLSGNVIDTSSIIDAREEITRTSTVLEEIEQNVRMANQQQQQFNQSIRDSASSTENLWSKLKGVAATVGGLAAVKNIVGVSDTLTSTNARLNLLVDDGGSLATLERNVMVMSQRTRTSYFDTAAAVSKLGLNAGNAFDHDTNQVIAFMEQVNKQFVIGGANAAEQSAAMIQLTQAMGAGALRGEELNSILDAAPGIARAIEQYMGVAEGSIKQYAEEGLITAQVVKNAMFWVADETNARFESMPMTWAQVFSGFGNIMIQVFQPLLMFINWLANNIEIIGPAVVGLGAAFVVFQIAAHWTQIAAFAAGVYHGVINLLSIGFGALTGKTAASSAAVTAFNSALLANPIVWVIMIIMVFIGAIYAGVAAYNKFTKSSVSATGIVAGVFSVLGAHVMNNTIVPMQNGFAMIANFIGNVFNDPVAAIKVLFFDMSLTVIGYIKNLAKGIETLINKIPGITIDITSGLDEFYSRIERIQQNVKDKSGWVEYVKKMDYVDYSYAASIGYKFGEGIEDKISNFFNPKIPDFNPNTTPFDSSLLDGIYNNTGDIADNTRNTSDAIEFSNEELELLRNIAEREAINKYTTAEIKVEMHNNNNISSEMDLDGFINVLENKLVEAMAVSAEGGHI